MVPPRCEKGASWRVGVITLGHGDEVVTLGPAVVQNHEDPYAGGSVVVELQGAGLAATRTVFVFASSGLSSFLAELAESWRGWSGVKVWESPDHDLTIEATFISGGHDRLRFTARNGPMPTWEAWIEVEVEAGEEITRISRDVAELLPRPRRP